ncbi:MAG: hypothetical protein Q9204_006470 [Flavoplaca sp. TL-2023a]
MAATARWLPTITKFGTLRLVGSRSLSIAPQLFSGHNRWSKIKHDKGKEDVSRNALVELASTYAERFQQAVRSKERSQWSRGIQEAVKIENGGDPTSNSELSTLMAQAKKAGLPKDLIERAIARGKGVSSSGDPLQTLTVEAMLPASVSTIIECQTDNKKRTLEDLRLLVKEAGGMVTPTSHLFDRRGHINLASKHELEEEKVMDQVLEAGAVDMDIGEDKKSLSVYTEPSETASIAQSLSSSLNLTRGSSEIVWVARPDSVINMEVVDEERRQALHEVLSQIEGDSSVQAIYHNAA